MKTTVKPPTTDIEELALTIHDLLNEINDLEAAATGIYCWPPKSSDPTVQRYLDTLEKAKDVLYSPLFVWGMDGVSNAS